jgi:hypothetical protein
VSSPKTTKLEENMYVKTLHKDQLYSKPVFHNACANSTRALPSCFGVSNDPEISEKRNIFGDLDSSPILKRKFSLLDKPSTFQCSSKIIDLKSDMLCNVEERDDISFSSSSSVDLVIEPAKLEDIHHVQVLSVQSSSKEKMKTPLMRSNAFCTI